jgi:multidrug resistance protein, MATE family
MSKLYSCGNAKPLPINSFPVSMNFAAADNRTSRPFPVNHVMVARLAVPMTLAYLTTPILGLVDTGVVGRMGDPALIGGLAIGAIVIDVIFTTFNFQRSGTTGLAAQAVGAEDEKEKQAILWRALLLAAVAGILTILLAPLILASGLWFMAPGADVAAATSTYFLIRVWGTPMALANYAFLGWLIGLGRSGTSLALQIFLNGTNILLSIYLGLWLGYGIAGVAWATVIAEAAAAIAGFLICRTLINPDEKLSRQRILHPPALKRLVNLNTDIMIRSFVLLAGYAFFTAQGAGYGEIVLAANAILLHFLMIGGNFLDGMATAAEQIVGRAIGANYRPAFDRGVKLTLIWNIVLALLLATIFWFGGALVIDLITTDQTVRNVANSYLIYAVIAPIAGILAFQMDGVFIGATWSRAMSIAMVFSFAIYVSLYWMMPVSWGNSAIWLALHAFFIVRGITLAAALPYMARKTFGTREMPQNPADAIK